MFRETPPPNDLSTVRTSSAKLRQNICRKTLKRKYNKNKKINRGKQENDKTINQSQNGLALNGADGAFRSVAVVRIHWIYSKCGIERQQLLSGNQRAANRAKSRPNKLGANNPLHHIYNSASAGHCAVPKESNVIKKKIREKRKKLHVFRIKSARRDSNIHNRGTNVKLKSTLYSRE